MQQRSGSLLRRHDNFCCFYEKLVAIIYIDIKTCARIIAYIFRQYISEDSGTSLDIDINDRDKLFREAAEVIVTAQQGSASLLQRKLKLGYNRAGRLIDQLEAAGIVGPFEGSKARQVLVTDLMALKQLLDNESSQ